MKPEVVMMPRSTPGIIVVVLTVVCGVIFLSTMVPTVYTFDSAEFAIGASEMGLVHAPGYPLYLLIAHLFTRLPLALDTAAKVNLLSVLSLTLTIPAVFLTLRRLIHDDLIAVGTAVLFGSSYYVWMTGVAAEIYAPQLATLAWTGALLAMLPQNPLPGMLMYGTALAVHPGSILLAPGVVAVVLGCGCSWHRRIRALLAGAAVTLAPLLYFPVRGSAQPTFNLLGTYRADGSFAAVDLTQPANLVWVLRGGQFDALFMDGAWRTFGQTLVANTLGVGLIIGVFGGWAMLQQHPRLLGVWLLGFVPFAVFYADYGAPDVETMLGPAHLLWTIPLALGFRWAVGTLRPRWRAAMMTTLALTLLIINYPLVNGSRETGARDRAALALNALPENGIVFGNWFDIVPLQYLHIVEDEKPGIRLYNLFLFEEGILNAFLNRLQQTDEPVFFVGSDIHVANFDTVPFLHDTSEDVYIQQVIWEDE